MERENGSESSSNGNEPSSSTAARTGQWQANRPPPKDFCMTSSAEESHGKKIYCAAWSTDVYRDDESLEPQCHDAGGTAQQSHDETKNHESVPGESSSCAEEDPTRKSRLLRCLATCGGNTVSVYEVELSLGGKARKGFELRQVYEDPDKEGEFYACAFGGRCLGQPFGYVPVGLDEITPILLSDGYGKSAAGKKRLRDDGEGSAPEEIDWTRLGLFPAMTSFDGPQLLCVGGTSGVIKVIDTVRRMLFLTLSGHGDDIHDLKFSPADEWLLLSASKDESIRLWNLQHATCVAIFAGHEGHRDAVLSVAWHSWGDRFVSSGMDTTVKLWNVGDGTAVHDAIQASKGVRPRLWDSTGESVQRDTFRTFHEQMPYFSTKKCHVDYVDCVQFVGDLVMSKSIDNEILLWKPVLTKSRRENEDKSTHPLLPNEVIALREFRLTHAEVWFIRFHTNENCTLLACGNNIGEIRVWEISATLKKGPLAKLVHQYCTSSIRMVTFSPDSRCLVATCDDASIWKWDAI